MSDLDTELAAKLTEHEAGVAEPGDQQGLMEAVTNTAGGNWTSS